MLTPKAVKNMMAKIPEFHVLLCGVLACAATVRPNAASVSAFGIACLVYVAALFINRKNKSELDSFKQDLEALKGKIEVMRLGQGFKR
jgi:hypothetical protein